MNHYTKTARQNLIRKLLLFYGFPLVCVTEFYCRLCYVHFLFAGILRLGH